MWAALNALGIPRWALAVVVLLALLGLFLWLGHREEQDDKINQEVGRTVEREEATRTVLERTELGNAVRAEAAACGGGDPAGCYDLCMRYDTGAPESCERFLPQRPEDLDGR